MRSYLLSSALAFGLCAGAAHAQLGKYVNHPNFPGGPTHRLDVQAIISASSSYTVNACLGVEIDNFGTIWVSARRDTTATTNPHMLYELKWNTTTQKWDVTGYQQPTGTQGSSWGIRDLAFDGVIHLYGGCEFSYTSNKIFAFNVATKKWDSSKDVTVTGSPVGTCRALAFDNSGDGGKGSLWYGDFSSAHVEVDLTGKVLRQVPNVQPSCYGAAYDPDRKTVWWFGQGYSTAANSATYPQVVGTEIWVSDGSKTGNRFIGDRGIAPSAGYHAGGIAGGMAFYKDQAGTPLFLCLHQATADTVSQLYGRFNYGTGSDGVISMNDHACSGLLLPSQTQSSFGLRLNSSTAVAGVLILGFSKSSIPLVAPFAPGSSLYTIPNIVGPGVPVATAKAEMAFPIPNDKALDQLGLWFQWAGVHTAAPFLLSTTDGGEVVINNM